MIQLTQFPPHNDLIRIRKWDKKFRPSVVTEFETFIHLHDFVYWLGRCLTYQKPNYRYFSVTINNRMVVRDKRK